MTRLTASERRAFTKLATEPLVQPALETTEQFVEPTPEARLDYIRFATAAAVLYRGSRPIGFHGDDWRL